MTIQGVLSYLLALIIFRNDAKEYIKEFAMAEDEIKDPAHRANRREMSRRWSYRVFLVIFAFGMASVPEEGFKYLALMCASKYGTIAHDRGYLIVPTAAALGFATTENIAFVYSSYKNSGSLFKLGITILERTIIGLPGHVISAALVVVNVLARDSVNLEFHLFRVGEGQNVLFLGQAGADCCDGIFSGEELNSLAAQRSRLSEAAPQKGGALIQLIATKQILFEQDKFQYVIDIPAKWNTLCDEIYPWSFKGHRGCHTQYRHYYYGYLWTLEMRCAITTTHFVYKYRALMCQDHCF
ncbi:hypothetical protein PV08_09998 [Exophiala spinifera]|uniref:Uncharacterized protein n=1 Tax=Exophiala spinifera TaxID=91928 RepID=A0A0D2B279_9EURO|nr:uncharacterized protein PV08_09998 [Exophiala spinifera]KIW12720.1 hypothetical protein PV08_09998 [Exophiala spinifera]